MMKLKHIAACIAALFIFTMAAGCAQTKKTITFDSDGGSSIAVCYDSVQMPPVPVKDGYDFMGWYMSASLMGEKLFFPYKAKEDVTLHAKWQRNALGDKIVMQNFLVKYGIKNGGEYILTTKSIASAFTSMVFSLGYNELNDKFILGGSSIESSEEFPNERICFTVKSEFGFNEFEQSQSSQNEVQYQKKSGDAFITDNTNSYTLYGFYIESKTSLFANVTPNLNNNYERLSQADEMNALTALINHAFRYANEKLQSVPLELQ